MQENKREKLRPLRVKDGLAPILEKAAEADVLILGTPLYFYAASEAARDDKRGQVPPLKRQVGIPLKPDFQGTACAPFIGLFSSQQLSG